MAESSSADLRSPDEWLAKLRTRDEALYRELTAKLEQRQAPAAGGLTLEGAADPQVVLETIVMEGRPALLVQGGRIVDDDPGIDAASRVIVERLLEHRATVEAVLPLVGRIDVTNHPNSMDFVGTGWLVDSDVVVTNRHVADMIARRGADGFSFIPGRFGDPMDIRVSYGREFGADAGTTARVSRVLWIEPDAKGPDVAFLQVDRRSDGLVRDRIDVSPADAETGDDVAVIGYPARAPEWIIPDQAWMERLYGGRYDVKRIAPGMMDDPDKGWSTHDCTTLGGNSGSAVIDMRTGAAVALHFAGLYRVTNYAVPASTLRKYLKDRPWQGGGTGRRETPAVAAGAVATAQVTARTGTAVTLQIPITVTVSVGEPEPQGGAAADVEAAAEALAAQLRGGGVLAVKAGVAVERGAMTGEPCIVVAAAPERLDEVSARAPAEFQGFEVQVRPASLRDQLGVDEAVVAEAPGGNGYDDANRTGPQFRFGWIEERMQLRCHVGPERSFEELKAFLSGAQSELVSSMYQFYAEHVRAAVEGALSGAVEMRLVLDPQTRDRNPPTPAGEFDRSDTFARWEGAFPFARIFVPKGGAGLVDSAYHIKVTVRDGSAIWLSSGNWTRSSQPLIPTADRLDPGKTNRAGNREWHVTAVSPTLAERFRAHILQDFVRSGELGGGPEAPADEVYVDVPLASLESPLLEGPPAKVVEPLAIDRKVRVKPLLTPDGRGKVYGDAVIDLIGSARTQLLFQNQYIHVGKASAGRFGDLVDALIERSKAIADCRIILRSDGAGFWDDIAELKRRGLDVAGKVRRLAHTHTKGIVVDGRRVLVGSHNWSGAGVTVNRDASLIFDDRKIAGYFAGVFELDWRRAKELTVTEAVPDLEAPRLAAGPAPPPGFMRLPLADYLEG